MMNGESEGREAANRFDDPLDALTTDCLYTTAIENNMAAVGISWADIVAKVNTATPPSSAIHESRAAMERLRQKMFVR